MLRLDKVDLKFRSLSDLFLLSNNSVPDSVIFSALLKDKDNFNYFWNRFRISSNIFWEDNNEVWYNKFIYLLSLNNKSLSTRIERFLEKRFKQILLSDKAPHIIYDIEYSQYVQFCKAKKKLKHKLKFVREFLLSTIERSKFERSIPIVKEFIPTVFKDINDLSITLSNKLYHGSSYLIILRELEKKHGAITNNVKIYNIFLNLLSRKNHTFEQKDALLSLIIDDSIFALIKQNYNPSIKKSFTSLVKNIGYYEVVENNFKAFKNIIEIDNSFLDSMVESVITSIYKSYFNARKINLILKLMKSVPEIQPKKVFYAVANNNGKMEMKTLVRKYPELKGLSLFY